MKARAAILLWLLAGVAGAQTTIRPGGSSGGGVTPATLNDATYCPDVGASDAYVCSMVSAPSSYAAGMLVTLSANTANTGTASVNVNSLGVKTITRADGSTLATGDITATSPVLLEYDGSNNFRMLSTPSFVATGIFGSSTSGNVGIGTAPSSLAKFQVKAGTNQHFWVNSFGSKLTIQAVDDAGSGNVPMQFASTGYAFLGSGTAEFVGGALIRSTTYASGSDVGLTVQGSLTGNIQNWKNSGGTALASVDVNGAATFRSVTGGTSVNNSGLTLNGGSTGGSVGLNGDYSVLSLQSAGAAYRLVAPTYDALRSDSFLYWIDSTNISTGAESVVLSREGNSILQLGRDVNGSAVNQTFKAHDGITGTDISGANLTIAAGRGTGAGSGGSLIFQTAPVGSTGTTAQTLATVLTLGKDASATFTGTPRASKYELGSASNYIDTVSNTIELVSVNATAGVAGSASGSLLMTSGANGTTGQRIALRGYNGTSWSDGLSVTNTASGALTVKAINGMTIGDSSLGTSVVPLTVTPGTGSTANILNVTNSAGSVLTSVASDGTFATKQGSDTLTIGSNTVGNYISTSGAYLSIRGGSTETTFASQNGGVNWGNITASALRLGDATVNTNPGIEIPAGSFWAKTGSKTLTNTTNTSFVAISVATFQGGIVDYCVEANDASDYQNRCGSVPFSVVNKGGTETCTIGTAADVVSVSAGTLTLVWATDTSGANSCALQVAATSSLTPTTLRIVYNVKIQGTTVTAITPQ